MQKATAHSYVVRQNPWNAYLPLPFFIGYKNWAKTAAAKMCSCLPLYLYGHFCNLFCISLGEREEWRERGKDIYQPGHKCIGKTCARRWRPRCPKGEGCPDKWFKSKNRRLSLHSLFKFLALLPSTGCILWSMKSQRHNNIKIQQWCSNLTWPDTNWAQSLSKWTP